MEETWPPNPSVADLKKHVMDVFKDATKDCKDKKLKAEFRRLGSSYDCLNNCATDVFNFMVGMGAMDIAREMFKPYCGILSEVAVFTIVITLYAGTGKSDSTLKVYHKMMANGVNPVRYTYSQLICVLSTDFSDAKYLQYAKKFFLETLDKRMKLQQTPFWTIMEAIAYQEPLEKFKKFIDQVKAKGLILQDSGFHHNEAYLAQSWETLKMYAHLVHSDTIDKDVRCYFDMKSVFPCHIKRLLNKMLTALVLDGNFSEAREFRDKLDESAIEPMVVIHTYLIKVHLKFGKTKGALEAYLAMLAAGVAPNSYTYTILIKGLSADPRFFGHGKKHLLEMMDKGKRPNAATFTAVIEGFAKQEDKAAEEEGKEFVRVMVAKGFVPDLKAMMEVLKGRPTPAVRSVMSIVVSALRL